MLKIPESIYDIHDRRRVDYPPPPMPDLSKVLDLSKHLVLVPVHRFVDQDTNFCLWGLHDLGVKVKFSKGASAIDATRNALASAAVKDKLDSILFIDADMVFGPEFAIKLLLSDAPVIAGLYAAKVLGRGRINACFPDGTKQVKFGDWATEPVPLKRVGAGFLRIKVAVLKTLTERLELPYCRMADGFAWPFFQPLIYDEGGTPVYLTEDYAFCHRCGLAGIPIVGDAQDRLYHLGDYAFGLEEASGQYIERQRNLFYDLPPES